MERTRTRNSVQYKTVRSYYFRWYFSSALLTGGAAAAFDPIAWGEGKLAEVKKDSVTPKPEGTTGESAVLVVSPSDYYGPEASVPIGNMRTMIDEVGRTPSKKVQRACRSTEITYKDSGLPRIVHNASFDRYPTKELWWHELSYNNWEKRGRCYCVVHGTIVMPSLADMHASSSNALQACLQKINLSAAMDQALFNAVPGHEPKVSGLNFLWELKDFANYAKGLKHISDAIRKRGLSGALEELEDMFSALGKSLDPKWREIFGSQSFRNRVVRFIFRNPSAGFLAQHILRWLDMIANCHLQWVFGWKPFLSDVVLLNTVAQTVQGDIEMAQRELQLSAPRRSRGRSSYTVNENAVPVGSFIVTGSNTADIKCTVVSSVVTTIAPKGSLEPSLSHFVDKFGLALSPTVVWNGIPFSWALDQIVNVSDYLATLTPNTSLYVNLSVLCESTKITWEVVYKWKGQIVGTVTEVQYDRKPYGTRWLLNPPNQVPQGLVWKLPSAGSLLTDLTVVWGIFSNHKK